MFNKLNKTVVRPLSFTASLMLAGESAKAGECLPVHQPTPQSLCALSATNTVLPQDFRQIALELIAKVHPDLDLSRAPHKINDFVLHYRQQLNDPYLGICNLPDGEILGEPGGKKSTDSWEVLMDRSQPMPTRYIKIKRFNELTTNEVKNYLEASPAAGVLVIDLTNSPGGLTKVVEPVAELIKERNLMVFVHVNQQTASAAEELIYLLRASDLRVVVVGTETKGKNNTQDIYKIPAGRESLNLVLTVEQRHAKGTKIKPDIEVCGGPNSAEILWKRVDEYLQGKLIASNSAQSDERR